MNTVTLAQTRGFTLRQLLVFDALTCMVMGLLLLATAKPLAGLLGLPQGLLFYAGLVLVPCAALMAAAARTLAPPLVWMVILGNFAWAVASLVVVFVFDLTAIGLSFTLAQAAVVAGLGVLEQRAAR